MIADQKMIRDRTERDRLRRLANPLFVPACWCGEIKDIWASSGWPETKYYCEKHFLEELR